MANDPPRSGKEKRRKPDPCDEEIPAAADSGDKGSHPGGRICSDEYTVAVLRGPIEFRSRTGGAPTASTTGAFFDSIKDSLPPTVTQDQLYRKVRRLRNKYNQVARDYDAVEDVPYRDLLLEAWGSDEKKPKVKNLGVAEEKKAEAEHSAVNTPKPKKAKVEPSGTKGELEVKGDRSNIKKVKVAFAKGDVSSANWKPKVSNIILSETPSRKRKGEMTSPVSIQERGKLEVKEVQSKGKVPFAKDAISSSNSKDKIGKKRPSRTTSKKRKAKELSPVATQEEGGSPVATQEEGWSDSWQYDYTDKGDWPGVPRYAGKKFEDWDTDDLFEASDRNQEDPAFDLILADKMADWF